MAKDGCLGRPKRAKKTLAKKSLDRRVQRDAQNVRSCLTEILMSLFALRIMNKVPATQATDVAVCVDVVKQLHGVVDFPVLCATGRRRNMKF